MHKYFNAVSGCLMQKRKFRLLNLAKQKKERTRYVEKKKDGYLGKNDLIKKKGLQKGGNKVCGS